MASKTPKKKKQPSSEERRVARQRRTLQVAFVIFSILLILSMILSLTANY